MTGFDRFLMYQLYRTRPLWSRVSRSRTHSPQMAVAFTPRHGDVGIWIYVLYTRAHLRSFPAGLWDVLHVGLLRRSILGRILHVTLGASQACQPFRSLLLRRSRRCQVKNYRGVSENECISRGKKFDLRRTIPKSVYSPVVLPVLTSARHHRSI